MSVKGDFSKLDRLLKGLGEMADGKVMNELRGALQETALTQVRLGFRLSRDPYGVPWKPLKRPRKPPARKGKGGGGGGGGGSVFSRVRRAVRKFLRQVGLSATKGGHTREKPNGGTGQILIDTGRLRASWSAFSTPTGFRLGSGASYAKFHQQGGRRLPARKMVPDPNRPSPIWNDALRRSADRTLVRALRKFR